MEWLPSLGNALTAGLPALFTGLFMWLLFRTQLKEQSRKEKRQRQIEVRSEPLLELRARIASMASYIDLSQRMQQLDKMLLEIGSSPTDGVREFLEQATSLKDFHAEVRTLQKAQFQVDDAEIQNRVDEVISRFVDALSTGWGKAPVEEFKELSANLDEARQALVQVQNSINKRLEALGCEKGIST